MWAYGIFLLIMPFGCRAMEPLPSPMEIELPPSVMLKDINNKHVATLNPQEYDLLKKLNPALRTKPKNPSGGLIVPYSVETGLNEEQINSLVRSIKSQENFNKAIVQGLINIDIAPEQLKEVNAQLEELGLLPVDNVLIIQTADNLLVSLEKKVAIHFFKTISDLIVEFPLTLAIKLNIRAETLLLIYELVRTLSGISRTAELWENTEKFIKDKQIVGNKLLNLILAGEFLGLENIYVLAGLFEQYKPYVTTSSAWDQLMKSSIFKKMAEASRGLKVLKENASVKQVDGVWLGVIQSSRVNSLKGIEIIKDIDKCEALFIVNTDIDKVEKDSLKSLPNIKQLAFISNKKLTKLEKNCLKSPTLNWLLFYQNNITELSAEVFDLPNLTNLLFYDNNLQVIKANWGIKLGKLNDLYFIEPNFKTFEPGWLNGLNSMTFFFYKEDYYLNNFLQILRNGFLSGQQLTIDKIDIVKMNYFIQLLQTRTTEPMIFVKNLFQRTPYNRIITG